MNDEIVVQVESESIEFENNSEDSSAEFTDYISEDSLEEFLEGGLEGQLDVLEESSSEFTLEDSETLISINDNLTVISNTLIGINSVILAILVFVIFDIVHNAFRNFKKNLEIK